MVNFQSDVSVLGGKVVLGQPFLTVLLSLSSAIFCFVFICFFRDPQMAHSKTILGTEVDTLICFILEDVSDMEI